MKKKFASYILILAMLTSYFTACSGTGDTAAAETTSGEAAETSSAAESETAAETTVSDDLPDADFNGGVYTILIREGFQFEFDVESEDGEVLNDAIYARNRAVEERFDVDLKVIARASAWGDPAFNDSVNQSILSGDDVFSIVAGKAAMTLGCIVKNNYINWYDIDYIDISKPWWSEQIADSLTVNDRLYAMTGDISLGLWQCMIGIFYNKKLAENYGISELYQCVKDGSWTFAKLQELCKGISVDLNGDGEYTDEDFYAYSSNASTSVDAYLQAFNIKVVSRTDDGGLECTLNNEKTINALEMLETFFWGDNSANILGIPFADEKAIFTPLCLNDASKLRDMDADFGILPYPKYDDAQEKYYSTSSDNFSLFVIPVTVSDIDMVGIVTEALCAESYRQVVPVYYDIVLKDKYSRDAESSEMMDIIRDNLVFDIGYLNSFYLEKVGHMFVELVRIPSTDLASTYASKETAINKALAKMLDAYTD